MKRLIGYTAALCLLAFTVGCGGVTSTGTLAYLSNSNGTGFTVFNVNTDGTLTTSDISPQSTPAAPKRLVFSPNGKWAYFLDNAGTNLYAYTRAGNGELSTQVQPPYPLPAGATALAVAPNNNFVYVALPVTLQLQVFSIDPSTGILTGSTAQNIGYAIDQLVMAPGGGALFGLAVSQQAVVSFTLNSSSGNVTSKVSYPVGANPSYMILSQNGSYMYVLDSVLTAPFGNSTAPCTTGSTCSPTFFAFNVQSNGTLLYMNGQPFQENADLITGIYPKDPIGGATSNDNRWLFIANQGTHNISVFKIGTTSGEPTEVLGAITTVNGIQQSSASPFDCGFGGGACTTPSFLSVSNANNALYVLDTAASKIFQIAIDQNTGKLRALNPAFVSGESSSSQPVWITIR